MHTTGIDTVELRTSARLAEAVDDQHPDIVFLDCNPGNPYECVRALFSLRECRFAGRVQLLGRCNISLLESFERIGKDSSLAMLPPLQKPIDLSTIRRIVQGQKLTCRPVAARDLSLKAAIARNFITFWYQPKIDLQKRQIVGAEAFARVAHPQHGILSPALFLAGAAEEDLVDLAERAIVSAGNSSFEVFKSLPFAEIKIDGAFVQGCAANEDNANICKSMIQIAHNFGRKAAAVGIETPADSQRLAELGCDIGQGYLFGRPMTERHLITMLVAGRAESKTFCDSNVWDVSPRPI